MPALDGVRTLVGVNFRKGLWALGSRNTWPSRPGLARLTPPCMAMMRRKKEGCECMQFVRPFDCPCGRRRRAGGVGDKRSRVKLHAAIGRSRPKRLYSLRPPADEGNGNRGTLRLRERCCDPRARLHTRSVRIDPLEGRKGHIEFSPTPPPADLHRNGSERSLRAAGGSGTHHRRRSVCKEGTHIEEGGAARLVPPSLPTPSLSSSSINGGIDET